jgi:hypothetical protein
MCYAVDGDATGAILAPKLKLPITRYELSDCEWIAIKPMLRRS